MAESAARMLMRCDECAHWTRHGGDYVVRHVETARPWGECHRTDEPAALMQIDAYGAGDSHLETQETFGCVQFEAKG